MYPTNGIQAKFGRLWAEVCAKEIRIQIDRQPPADYYSRNKRRGCRASPPRFTSDGNADRVRLFEDFAHRGCKQAKWNGLELKLQ